MTFKNFFYSLFLSIAVLSAPTTALADTIPPIHHEMSMELQPQDRTARIRDRITFRPGGTPGSVFHLHLNADLEIEKMAVAGHPEWSVRTSQGRRQSQVPTITRLHVEKPGNEKWPDSLTLEIEYSGKLLDLQQQEEAANEAEVILFAGESYFYPRSRNPDGTPERVTFHLTVNAPADWVIVSQGRRLDRNDTSTTWESTDPMEEIFLVADRFEEYQEPHGDIRLHAFLKEKNPELAQRYIQAAKRYIDFYQKLLGPYPFPKFALVENSKQTGWGMPSFTLLGSRIIRFPFILNTSYPHEILHNWWGNGVYLDPWSGNWSEGLTAYLADHLLMEIEGKGSRYRFQELMKFLNYVNKENDFPLNEFRARDSMASQAIGYAKLLMVFHMLRMEVGDDTFLQALRHFYQQNRFRFAGFDELRESFESVSGKDLRSFFEQWTRRKGAPEIELASADIQMQNNRHLLYLDIRQKQEGPAFALKLLTAIWLKGSEKPFIETLELKRKSQSFTLILPSEPAAVQVDPYTEVFRLPDRNAVPASIGETYGADQSTAILPSANTDLVEGYRHFARTLSENHGTAMQLDMVPEVPAGSLWVFGRENRAAHKLIPQLEEYGVALNEAGVLIDGKKFPWEDHSFVFTLRRPDKEKGSATWVIAGSGKSVPGLIRKLPHYGKYGYLVFKGEAPDNQLKGTWPAKPTSLLKTFQPGKYTLPPKPPLVDFKPAS